MLLLQEFTGRIKKQWANLNKKGNKQKQTDKQTSRTQKKKRENIIQSFLTTGEVRRRVDNNNTRIPRCTSLPSIIVSLYSYTTHLNLYDSSSLYSLKGDKHTVAAASEKRKIKARSIEYIHYTTTTKEIIILLHRSFTLTRSCIKERDSSSFPPTPKEEEE